MHLQGIREKQLKKYNEKRNAIGRFAIYAHYLQANQTATRLPHPRKGPLDPETPVARPSR
jgi:hypothetical protein